MGKQKLKAKLYTLNDEYDELERRYNKVVRSGMEMSQQIKDLQERVRDLTLRFMPCPDGLEMDANGNCVKPDTGKGFFEFIRDGEMKEAIPADKRFEIEIPKNEVPVGPAIMTANCQKDFQTFKMYRGHPLSSFVFEIPVLHEWVTVADPDWIISKFDQLEEFVHQGLLRITKKEDDQGDS